MNNYKFILQPYTGPSSRFKCPGCGRNREFTRYLNVETGELLPDHVGKCNRSQNCSYHYTPKQYFDETIKPVYAFTKPTIKAVQSIPQKLDYIPDCILERSHSLYSRNNLYLWMTELFSEGPVNELFERYKIGSSKHWDNATVFWQIDAGIKVRQCKIMLYSLEGRRVKKGNLVKKWDYKTNGFIEEIAEVDCTKIYGKYINPECHSLNLRQCFFGEHLINLNPQKRIAIVESEKTALISSLYFPELTWIATGGKFGCKWNKPDVFNALKGREIILYPDLQAYDEWMEKAKEVRKSVDCRIMVSDILEKNATLEQKQKGLDLADYLINQDPSAMWALTPEGYPLFWDI